MKGVLRYVFGTYKLFARNIFAAGYQIMEDGAAARKCESSVGNF